MGILSNVGQRAKHAVKAVGHAAVLATSAPLAIGVAKGVGQSASKVAGGIKQAVRPAGGLRPISRIKGVASAVGHAAISPLHALGTGLMEENKHARKVIGHTIGIVRPKNRLMLGG